MRTKNQCGVVVESVDFLVEKLACTAVVQDIIACHGATSRSRVVDHSQSDAASNVSALGVVAVLVVVKVNTRRHLDDTLLFAFVLDDEATGKHVQIRKLSS